MHTLYKIDTKDGIREWKGWVDTINGIPTIVIEAGLETGKKTRTETPYTEGKNSGRANATTPYEQAVAELDSVAKGKIQSGYSADRNALTTKGQLAGGVPAVMLAYKYDPTMKQSGSKNLKKIGIEGEDVAVQDKKDGNRCLTHLTRTGALFYSRKGKLFPGNFEHLERVLVGKFNKIYDYVNRNYKVTEYWIDGELFINEFIHPVTGEVVKVSFNQLNGILKKQTLNEEDKILLSNVEYHIYDVIVKDQADTTYKTRHKILEYFVGGKVKLVPYKVVKATNENLYAALEEALERGEEGLMIRSLTLPYHNKRSWGLVKYKQFEDCECRIIGFNKSIEGDTLGSIEFMFDEKENITVKASFCGTDAEQKEIWDNQSKYLGTKMTLEYFGVSEYGVPRFPKAKGQRADVD